jgi:hypothetical protein
MEGAHGLIHRFLGRTRGTGLDHLREKAGLFVIQRNGHSCDSFVFPPVPRIAVLGITGWRGAA